LANAAEVQQFLKSLLNGEFNTLSDDDFDVLLNHNLFGEETAPTSETTPSFVTTGPEAVKSDTKPVVAKSGKDSDFS
jgi:hypothetical protein